MSMDNFKNMPLSKKDKLNKTQMKIYNATVEYISKNGYAPTLRELCKMTGIKSLSTAHYSINKLGRLGYIKTFPGKSRAILLEKESVEIVRCKNCKYRNKVNTGVAVWQMCHKFNKKMDDNFFCAYGEEK